MPSRGPAAPPPLISVIVTSYNYGRYLGAALASAVSQDYPNIEIIVTDNASTDNSWDVIQKFESNPRIRAFRQPQNIGAKANYDFGFSKSRGDFIAYLSADDYLLPGHFRRLADLLTRYPEIDLPYTDYITVLEDGHVARRIPHPGTLGANYVDIRNEFAQLLSFGPYQCLGTVMFRRSLMDEVGPFHPEILADDFEFLVRLAKLGRKFAYINLPSIAFREHAASLSGETFVREGYQVSDYIRIFEMHALSEMWRLSGYEHAVNRHLDWRIANASRYAEAAAVVDSLGKRISVIRDALAVSAERRTITRRANEPRVSVVIPTTDRLALLDDALQSVASQDADFEIVLVSDAGLDLGPYLSSQPYGERVRFVHLSKKTGIAEARNAGVRIARAEIICFLDDDDLLGPGQLSRLCQAVENGSMIAYCASNLLLDEYIEAVLQPRRILAQDLPAFLFEEAVAMLEIANSIPLGAIALRRQCIDRAAGFNPSIPILEAWEFLVRMSRIYEIKSVTGAGPQISQRVLLRGQVLGQNAPQYLGALETVYNLHKTADPETAKLRQRHAENVIAALRSTTPNDLSSVQGARALARTLSGFSLSTGTLT